jgi:hypothetical protein
MSPFISKEVWDKSLRLAGFSGNDVVLDSPYEHVSSATIIISTAIENEVAKQEDSGLEVPNGEKLLWLVGIYLPVECTTSDRFRYIIMHNILSCERSKEQQQQQAFKLRAALLKILPRTYRKAHAS